MAEMELPSASEPIKNIVLVGRTVNGKSATGNTLLGEKQFESKSQAMGVTMKCKMFRAAMEDGPIINVIDTPGLFDISVDAAFLSEEIIKCLSMAKEGIHAVLFILSVKNRISEEEEATLNALQRIFECKILDYFIVVFTGGDELEANEQTLDDYFSQGVPQFLTNVLRLCGRRMVVFDNRTTDKDKKADQLNQLLAHIANVGEQTGGIPYTDQLHTKIKQEQEKLREKEREIESKNLADAEKAAMKERSQMEHEQQLKMMAQLVEQTLQKSAEAHEKEMRQLRETIILSNQQQQREPYPFPVNPQPTISCNIM